MPPGSGRSPNDVPRVRLRVYQTCTGTRLGSAGDWPMKPRHGSAPGTTNSRAYATPARGNSATVTGTPGWSDSLPWSWYTCVSPTASSVAAVGLTIAAERASRRSPANSSLGRGGNRVRRMAPATTWTSALSARIA